MASIPLITSNVENLDCQKVIEFGVNREGFFEDTKQEIEMYAQTKLRAYAVYQIPSWQSE